MSRVVLISEFVRDLPWSRTRWTLALARAYADFGHEVIVLADGVDDPAPFEDLGVLLRLRRPERPSEDTTPRRFVAFAKEQLAALEPEHAISLTWLMPAAGWFPVEHTPWRRFRMLVGEGSPISLAFEAVQQRWLPTALLAARRARSEGPTPLGIGDLGLAAIDSIPESDERLEARKRLRTAHGIAPHERMVLASLVQDRGPRTRCVIDWARVRNDRLLVLASDWHSVRRDFAKAGLLERVTPIGQTRAPWTALAAADALLVPQHIGTGRLAALALVMGLCLESTGSMPQPITRARAQGVSLERLALALLERSRDARPSSR